MNLPTPLLDAAKHYAVEKNTTLTQLVITGLGQVLATEMATNQPSLLEFIRRLPQKQKLSRTEQKRRYQSAMQKKHG